MPRAVIALLSLVLSTPLLAATPSRLESGFDEFYRLVDASAGLPARARDQAIDRDYHRMFGRDADAVHIARLGDRDLEALFRAVSLAAGYSQHADYIETLAQVNTELAARGALARRHVFAHYKALLASNRFDQALQLRAAHPEMDMPPFPHVIERGPVAADKPSVLLPSADGSQLSHEAFALGAGPRIVVIASPYCHFAQGAVRDIERDPALSPLFRRHSSWVAPRDATVDGPVFAAWNRAHPTAPMSLAFDQAVWPLEAWDTPTFHFFRDGTLVRTVSGWPREGRRGELLAALREIGLDPGLATRMKRATFQTAEPQTGSSPVANANRR